MSDRELLGLAAKAAGIDVNFDATQWDRFWINGGGGFWNPLTDDGDALRLAVALGLVVDCSRPSAGEPFKQHAIWLDDAMSNAELIRRAITRAAAAIGKEMK